jgi:hypothetical protein
MRRSFGLAKARSRSVVMMQAPERIEHLLPHDDGARWSGVAQHRGRALSRRCGPSSAFHNRRAASVPVVLRTILWVATLTSVSGDAFAWGLQTHLFLAQHLLLALPAADPQLRRAALRLPRLVLAGACLPDLALIGRALGTRVFSRSHRWPTLRRFAAARSDEERAVAFGYASHLLADVVAHNEFVPEHEGRIARVAHVTHALCEWAMDDFVRGAALAEPGALLGAERGVLAEVVAQRMPCDAALARRAIDVLACADRVLRRSPLPRLCRGIARHFDHHLTPRFEAYVRDTATRLAKVGAALDGVIPDGEPEPLSPAVPAGDAWRAGRLRMPRSLA